MLVKATYFSFTVMGITEVKEDMEAKWFWPATLSLATIVGLVLHVAKFVVPFSLIRGEWPP
jgi:hydrogenase/urease accessory protein HupE